MWWVGEVDRTLKQIMQSRKERKAYSSDLIREKKKSGIKLDHIEL